MHIFIIREQGKSNLGEGLGSIALTELSHIYNMVPKVSQVSLSHISTTKNFALDADLETYQGWEGWENSKENS